jgi:hypothetical protein
MRTTETRIIRVELPGQSYPLEAIAHHIAFEVTRLSFTARPEHFHATGDEGGIARESFLVHFRNVVQFMYGQEKFANDCLVTHYLGGVSWTPTPPQWFRDDVKRCNELLADLTYERVAFEREAKMVWKGILEKAAYVVAEWEAFLRGLPSDRRARFQRPT